MVMPRKVAAIATATTLAITPTVAFAATTPPSAKKTCAALKKKQGAKAFNAKYGKGTKHTGAMAACIKAHTKKK